MRKQLRTFLTAMLCILSIMALCVGLAACGGNVAVESVSLNKTELTLEVDATETLVATIAPKNAKNKDVEWDSSNTAAATVDQNGKVTAVAEGTATITVTTKDGGKSATCEVTVTEKAPTVSVTGVSLNKNSLILEVDGEETLIATVAPDNATNKNVIWASDDESIATVDAEGKVTAVAEGTATITVTTEDGEFTDECEVIVTDSGAVSVSGVTLDKESLELVFGREDKVDSEGTLTATVAPADATNKNVTWSSSAEEVATVDQSGKVTAVGVGTANITVTTKDGNHTARCIVIVRAHNHELTYVSDGEEGHHQECTVCGYKSAVGEHTTQLVSDGESGHHTQCSAEGCGYASETIEGHDLILTSEGANTIYHYRVCDCGYQVEENHTRLLETKTDPEDHWVECSECGWQSSKTLHTLEYRHEGSEHWQVCVGVFASIGGRTCPYETAHEEHSGTEYAVKEGDSDHHYAKCASCEELYGEALEHTPGLNGICTACGVEAGEHVHSYTYDEKGYTDGICSVCSDYESVWTFKEGTISAYNGTFEKVKVPAEISETPVTTFGNSLFASKAGLKAIIIPDSVTSPGNMTFRTNTSIETVILGTGIKTITAMMFYGCTSLQTLLFKAEEITSFAATCFNNIPSTAKFYFSMEASALLMAIESGCANDSIKTLVEGFKKQYYCYYVNQPAEAESLNNFAGAWHYDSNGDPTLWNLPADLSAQTFVMINNEKKIIF